MKKYMVDMFDDRFEILNPLINKRPVSKGVSVKNYHVFIGLIIKLNQLICILNL